MTERVLMIEDDERLAGMVRDYLGEAGYAVEVAGTGAGGLWVICQRLRLRSGTAARNGPDLAGDAIVAQPELGPPGYH